MSNSTAESTQGLRLLAAADSPDAQRGRVMSFYTLMFLGMAILIVWPQIATWLPSTMQLGR